MDDREVVLSEKKTIVMREINALEAMRAELFAVKLAASVGDDAPNAQITYRCYAICSIRSVNGTAKNPLANYAEFLSVGQDLTLPEATALLNAFVETLGAGDPKDQTSPPAAS